jgi:A/G-specific adenine glycosylase
VEAADQKDAEVARRARTTLSRWFRGRRALYPWRIDPSPYRVLVSEVMLQQTQAARVAPAFDRFLARFPDVRTLARAGRADVVRAWGSLGYNRRAVALHEAARIIVRDHGGRVPSDVEGLRRLPGVGPYTAAAVVAMGHGAPVVAMDTNVRRVVARAAMGRDASNAHLHEVIRVASRWLDRNDPGGWNQAVMDLGRELCRSTPRCEACPLSEICRFRQGRQALAAAPRRHAPYQGSFRQLRGEVVAHLRGTPSTMLGSLARSLGTSRESAAAAVRSLTRDGLVEAGPAALAGRPGGRVRLLDG